MQCMRRIFSTNVCKSITNNSVNNTIIFYKFVGNFPPEEWKWLTDADGKALGKTEKQLLAVIVRQLQVYNNKNIEEIQENYNFFTELLGVGQPRVRQCLSKLQKAGFIKYENRTITKGKYKLNHILCIKLVRNFQQVSNFEKEKTVTQTEKIFPLYPKKISGPYIDIIIKK
ncbi:Uncharacterised protein [Orientia tsutsugamushi]|uniref:Uncharacterized protein n=2 Tax=Orientia tsutsugamushi TaxID=784 RepID=A0A2U3R499_ORITS|nr:Uncharacterised protein [Orientia tsutsugamushi]